MCWQVQVVHVRLIWNSVVSNQRVRQDQDLAAIAGVGQGLRIAHHASVEHHLSRRRDLRAEAETRVRATVLEHEGSHRVLSHPGFRFWTFKGEWRDKTGCVVLCSQDGGGGGGG